MSEQTFTVKELSQYLDVERQTVYNWLNKGILESKQEGKAVKRTVITRSELERFAKEQGIDISDLDDYFGGLTPCVAAA